MDMRKEQPIPGVSLKAVHAVPSLMRAAAKSMLRAEIEVERRIDPADRTVRSLEELELACPGYTRAEIRRYWEDDMEVVAEANQAAVGCPEHDAAGHRWHRGIDVEEERRLDPQDGSLRSFAELKIVCTDYTTSAIEQYWGNVMTNAVWTESGAHPLVQLSERHFVDAVVNRADRIYLFFHSGVEEYCQSLTEELSTDFNGVMVISAHDMNPKRNVKYVMGKVYDPIFTLNILWDSSKATLKRI